MIKNIGYPQGSSQFICLGICWIFVDKASAIEQQELYSALFDWLLNWTKISEGMIFCSKFANAFQVSRAVDAAAALKHCCFP